MNSPALSFGSAAATYDRHRPTYPPPAVHWALGSPPGPLRVVDLGAGTGILTRVLIGLGHDVVPVEPDASMRARLSEVTPGVTPLDGSSESIPLASSSVDAVVAGQSYHWFDPDRAHVEIARVLRPGGHFAAIWNLRDESVPWVTRLGDIAHMGDHERTDQNGLHDEQLRAAGFGPVSRQVFTHSVTYTPDTLVELVKTRSYYLTAPPDEQAAVVAGIRDLTATDPALTGRATFPLPYRTVIFRTPLETAP
jgi:SAM-dependent methyltransferase